MGQLWRWVLAVAALLLWGTAALAEPAARDLFGQAREPAAMASASIGFYSRGCLAGGVAMPRDGPTWQTTRPARHRSFGHPAMIDLLERLSAQAAAQDGWPGFLVADIAQPRGGPMTNGHASHQIGLDADVYLTPMSDHRMSDAERDAIDPPSLIDARTLRVDPARWRPEHYRLLRRVALAPEVERIFVHPGIKEKLCAVASGDRGWLAKVRPMYGHDYHFHIRMRCPPGATACESQEPVGRGDGCGDLSWWFDVALQPPPPGAKPPRPKPPLAMSDLPRACRGVLDAPAGAAASGSGPAPVLSAIPTPTERPSH